MPVPLATRLRRDRRPRHPKTTIQDYHNGRQALKQTVVPHRPRRRMVPLIAVLAVWKKYRVPSGPFPRNPIWSASSQILTRRHHRPNRRKLPAAHLVLFRHRNKIIQDSEEEGSFSSGSTISGLPPFSIRRLSNAMRINR